MVLYHDRINFTGLISSGIRRIVCLCYHVLRAVWTMLSTLREPAALATRGAKIFRWKTTCATTTIEIRDVLWHCTDINECPCPTRLGSKNQSTRLSYLSQKLIICNQCIRLSYLSHKLIIYNRNYSANWKLETLQAESCKSLFQNDVV